MSHLQPPLKAVTYSSAFDISMPPTSAIDAGILQAIAYADVFEYPLAADEVYRYLVGVNATPETVLSRLNTSRVLCKYLTTDDEFYLLRGRDDIVATRCRRAHVAARLWPQAITYGRIIAHMPFVRMVAVTGALAVNNAAPNTDIDYFVVTAPGRLWLCRAAVIAVVRWASRQGVWLCPNYFVTERALVFEEQSLYAAHEVAQMVPLVGMATYRRMRRSNLWTARYLPNADGPPSRCDVPADSRQVTRALSRAGELALRTPAGDWVERWEMNRKVAKFTANGDGHAEAHFGPDCCKGHFDTHGARTLAEFAKRLRDLDLQTE